MKDSASATNDASTPDDEDFQPPFVRARFDIALGESDELVARVSTITDVSNVVEELLDAGADKIAIHRYVNLA